MPFYPRGGEHGGSVQKGIDNVSVLVGCLREEEIRFFIIVMLSFMVLFKSCNEVSRVELPRFCATTRNIFLTKVGLSHSIFIRFQEKSTARRLKSLLGA